MTTPGEPWVQPRPGRRCNLPAYALWAAVGLRGHRRIRCSRSRPELSPGCLVRSYALLGKFHCLRESREVEKLGLPCISPDLDVSVSVIVPAFNMELFIEECLRSLFEQTVDRLEIIVVEMDRPIDTREIVEIPVSAKGKSLILISKPNGGLSSARNAGMKAAQGRWIGFVDADDWVTSSMYSVLFSEAESAGADFAVARNLSVNQLTGAKQPSHDTARWNEFIASHGRPVNPARLPGYFLARSFPVQKNLQSGIPRKSNRLRATASYSRI